MSYCIWQRKNHCSVLHLYMFSRVSCCLFVVVVGFRMAYLERIVGRACSLTSAINIVIKENPLARSRSRSLSLSLSPRWRLLLSWFRLSLKVKLLWDESKGRSKRVSGTPTSLLEVFPEKTSKHQKSQKRRLGGEEEKCGGDGRRIQLSWTPEREISVEGFCDWNDDVLLGEYEERGMCCMAVIHAGEAHGCAAMFMYTALVILMFGQLRTTRFSSALDREFMMNGIAQRRLV